ncbi:MAG TPA: hypothetical protein VH188_05335 [Chthoniobacterales bacterium]|jgi:hypothetical protein|nr:hypothetical protein [Chthoniobacterales bacterium]
MATFYRGAGVGSYWHRRDARITGFVAHEPGANRNLPNLIGHVRDGTTKSPYISLTRSYSVAWNYAVGWGTPTAADPAFVYAIEINNPPPAGLQILDPLLELLQKFNCPIDGATYHHDGNPDFLIGVIDRTNYQACLDRPIQSPPPGGATARPANLCPELETIVRALRDAELLAVGIIPRECVVTRYEVF